MYLGRVKSGQWGRMGVGRWGWQEEGAMLCSSWIQKGSTCSGRRGRNAVAEFEPEIYVISSSFRKEACRKLSLGK